MTKSGDTGIKSKTTLSLVGEKVLDFLGSDFGTVLVASTLGDNDNGLALSEAPVL